MEPKRTFLPKNPDFYRPLNGSALNGAMHSPDATRITVNDDKALKNQIMMRLKELEKQNDGLKKIINQRKNEITDLIAANKKYISVLAHDLKSPFSTIYGVLEILKECIHENNYDEMEEYIDIASSSSLNTTNLIENILTWAQSQSPQNRFNPIKVNLANFVGREIENSNLALKLKKISLAHSIPQSFMVRADFHMTQSIIRNLISNAIKFTNNGGNIAISAKESDTFIEIMVKDNGIGITQKNQQKLFKKEFPDLDTGNGSEKSRGFGLVICKEFVEVQGGTIRVESQQNKGSSFIFTLPKYE
jgi:two-component system, sensor histidine kinase and response regulator